MSEKQKRAVVIDDDPDIRIIVKTLLEAQDWKVVEGIDGEDAWHLAFREVPDLIVMDVMMPKMSGFDALKELRGDPRTSYIPVILLTAVNDYELGAQHDAGSAGRRLRIRAPEAFLEKPFDSKGFLEVLEEVMKD